jgi:hypothetical protein
MRHCPKCQRTYTDDTQSFCFEDGTQLVSESYPSYGSQATLVMPAPPAPTQAPGVNQRQTSPAFSVPTVALPGPSERKKSSLPWILGGVGAFLLLGLLTLAAVPLVLLMRGGQDGPAPPKEAEKAASTPATTPEASSTPSNTPNGTSANGSTRSAADEPAQPAVAKASPSPQNQPTPKPTPLPVRPAQPKTAPVTTPPPRPVAPKPVPKRPPAKPGKPEIEQ